MPNPEVLETAYHAVPGETQGASDPDPGDVARSPIAVPIAAAASSQESAGQSGQMPPRVTVIEQVYYQHPEASPEGVETRYTVMLDPEGEQPWVRRFKVGPEWKFLECGWIKSASLLILANETGKVQSVIPTPEQKRETEERVIQLGIAGCTIVQVRPGTDCRLEPADLPSLLIRCPTGEARAVLRLYPA